MQKLIHILITVIMISNVCGMERVIADKKCSEGGPLRNEDNVHELFVKGDIEFSNKNYEGALQCFKKVADQNESTCLQGKSIKRLGDLYCDYIEGNETYEQALEFYKISSDEVYDTETRKLSFIRLAILYYFGLGCKKDEVRQKEYASKAFALTGEEKKIEEILSMILIEEGIKEGSAKLRGLTDLHLAALCGLKKLVMILTLQGADVKAVDFECCTSLHVAASAGYKEVVELLIEKGADIRAVTKSDETCLHLAVKYGQKEVVQFLLQKGADCHGYDKHGWTCLHLAVWGGYRDIIELLLDSGADIQTTVNKGDVSLYGVQGSPFWGDTCLHLAVKSGRSDVVKLLLKRGARVDVPRFTKPAERCHQWIVRNDRKDMLELLYKDLDTALEVAKEKGYFDVVTYLVSLRDASSLNVQGREALQVGVAQDIQKLQKK